MIGGKLISQGTFGCVYYPQKNCDGVDMRQQEKKYITKLVVDDKYMDHELYIGKLIQSIPSYETFFSPTVDADCKLNSVALKRMNVNGKCNVIKKHKERNGNVKFRLTKSLFVSNFTLQKRLASLSHHTLIMDTFIQIFSGMLANIERMQSKGIVHFDIHDRNIMMRGNRPLVIDFGISFTYDDMIRAATDRNQLKKIFYYFAPQMDHIPPEIHYIGFLLHERDSLHGHFHNWKYVKDSILENQSLIRLIIPTQEKRDVYYQQMEQTFRRMDKHSLEQIIQQFRWEKIDTYMLCMIGLNYIYYISENKDITETRRFNDLFSLLKAGIHPDPKHRYSLLELQEKIKPLLQDKNKGRKQKGKRMTVSQKREIEKKSEMISTIRTMRK